MIDGCTEGYEAKELKVLTIHDSVIVEEEKEAVVKDIVYKAFSSWGVRPLITTKR